MCTKDVAIYYVKLTSLPNCPVSPWGPGGPGLPYCNRSFSKNDTLIAHNRSFSKNDTLIAHNWICKMCQCFRLKTELWLHVQYMFVWWWKEWKSVAHNVFFRYFEVSSCISVGQINVAHWQQIWFHTLLWNPWLSATLAKMIPSFWEFLGILRNSQLFPFMQIMFALSKLGIPGNS